MFRQLKYIIILTFVAYSFGPLPGVYADGIFMPKPGEMVLASPIVAPAVLKGIKVDQANPFKLDFILDPGDAQQVRSDESLKNQANTLVKYFLASLTIPANNLWVNLSPYEKERIIPLTLGQTDMGKDLLAQDYLLKQMTASLMHPDSAIGKKFWRTVYSKAAAKFGTTQIPVNTINKVWVVPNQAEVYDNGKGVAYITKATLKVMLEEDYLASRQAGLVNMKNSDSNALFNNISQQIIREIIIPELAKEVNEGKNFAPLRQVYYSIMLATWYKRAVKSNIIKDQYMNQQKIQGIDIDNQTTAIYRQYLNAFKKGVSTIVRDEEDVLTHQQVTRKYFTGGEKFVGIDESILIHQRSPDHEEVFQHVVVDLAMDSTEKSTGILLDESVSDFKLKDLDDARRLARNLGAALGVKHAQGKVHKALFSKAGGLKNPHVRVKRSSSGFDVEFTSEAQEITVIQFSDFKQEKDLLSRVFQANFPTFVDFYRSYVQEHPGQIEVGLIKILEEEYTQAYEDAYIANRISILKLAKPSIDKISQALRKVFEDFDPEGNRFMDKATGDVFGIDLSVRGFDAVVGRINLKMRDGKGVLGNQENASYLFKASIAEGRLDLFLDSQEIPVKDKEEFLKWFVKRLFKSFPQGLELVVSKESVLVNHLSENYLKRVEGDEVRVFIDRSFSSSMYDVLDRSMTSSESINNGVEKKLNKIFSNQVDKALDFMGVQLEDIVNIESDYVKGHLDVQWMNVFLQDQRIKKYFIKKDMKNADISFIAMKIGIGPKLVKLSMNGGQEMLYLEEHAQGNLLDGVRLKFSDKADVLNFVSALAFALGRLHHAGIIHQDIIDPSSYYQGQRERLLHRQHIFVQRNKSSGQWDVQLIDYDHAEGLALGYSDNLVSNLKAKEEGMFKDGLINYLESLPMDLIDMQIYSTIGIEFWNDFNQVFDSAYANGHEDKAMGVANQPREGGVDFKAVDEQLNVRKDAVSSRLQLNNTGMHIKQGLHFTINSISSINLQDWLHH